MKTPLPRRNTGLSSFATAALGALTFCGWAVPPAFAAPGSWSRGADMPMAISTPAACAVDDVLYVIGGHDRSFRQLATVFAYDPKTDAWTRKADMPTARRWLSVAPVDGIIYALGGGGWRDPVLKVVEAYDPKTDTWTPRPPMPTGRSAFAACAVDGIIYAIGGYETPEDQISTVDAYDPKTDRWVPKHAMPKPGGMLAAGTVDGRIYVQRGTQIFVYDPKTDGWTTRTVLPTFRRASMVGVVDGVVFVFGGFGEDYVDTCDFATAYDPVSGWVSGKRRIPRTRAGSAGAVIGGKVYLVGGASQEPVIHPDAVFYSILDIFDPRGGIDPRILAAIPESPASIRLTWQAEVGIRYGVMSAVNVVRGPWTPLKFSPQAASVLATNTIMEAVALLPAEAPNRFLRLVEAK